MLKIPDRVLVTGGCGFLGSNITSSFLKLGANVLVIDAMFRDGCESNLAWIKSQSLHPDQF